MSVSICASCLSRLRLSSRTIPSLSAVSGTSEFHTSATQYGDGKSGKKRVLKGPAGKTYGYRESRSAAIKKKARVRPKPPAIGERKAAKKRIVLSNTNALEVPEMADLSVDNMSDAVQIGKVLGLQGPLLDQLRDVKAFKTTQNWSLFRRPATLIREETVSMGQDFEDVNDSVTAQESRPKTVRQIITGERSSGKSMLLLQAMSMAFLNKWVVVNVPEAQDLVNNTSSYGPAPKAEGEQEQHYYQPRLSSMLLTRIADGSGEVLSQCRVSHDHSSTNIPITKGMSLKDLAMVGVEELSMAWPTWQALWKELTATAPNDTTPPPPVLVAIDGLDHWMGESKYRSPDFKILHAHQFLLVRHLLHTIFSNAPLANGGIVLAATTASNSPTSLSMDVLFRQMQARGSGLSMTDAQFPMPEPYAKADQRVLNLLNGSEQTTVQTLKGLSKQGARGLLEYFARSGLWREPITEAIIAEKWTLSGGGIAGELAKYGTRVRV